MRNNSINLMKHRYLQGFVSLAPGNLGESAIVLAINRYLFKFMISDNIVINRAISEFLSSNVVFLQQRTRLSVRESGVSFVRHFDHSLRGERALMRLAP